MSSLILKFSTLSVFLEEKVQEEGSRSAGPAKAYLRQLEFHLKEMEEALTDLYDRQPAALLRQLHDCQSFLEDRMDQLTAQLPLKTRKTLFILPAKGRTERLIFRVLMSLDDELRRLHRLFPAMFNGNAPLPYFSRCRQLNSSRHSWESMRQKLMKKEMSNGLKEVLKMYLRDYSSEGRGPFTFNDCHHAGRLAEYLNMILEKERNGNMGRRIGKCLWNNGFNFPPFVRYYLEKYQEEHMERIRKPLERMKVLCSLKKCCPPPAGGGLCIVGYPPMERQLERYVAQKTSNLRMERLYVEQLERMSIEVNMPVIQLAMLMNVQIETGMIPEHKKKVAEFISASVRGPRGHQIAAHSFTNHMSERSYVEALRLVNHLESMINWLYRHTDLKDCMKREVSQHFV